MPFTPFHFGPSSCIALPLDRYIDVPTFVFANVVVDIEPLAVMVFGLNYPLHGYCHTFLIGILVGIFWASISYSFRGIFRTMMGFLRLSYTDSFGKLLLSAVLGIWFHVALDSFLYSDIKPLYPLEVNPIYGLVTQSTLYLICAISFIPALVIYCIKALSFRKGLM